MIGPASSEYDGRTRRIQGRQRPLIQDALLQEIELRRFTEAEKTGSSGRALRRLLQEWTRVSAPPRPLADRSHDRKSKTAPSAGTLSACKSAGRAC